MLALRILNSLLILQCEVLILINSLNKEDDYNIMDLNIKSY